ncbi:hypothetical protein OZ410_04035 [Robiginitalea sp. M366]|uniref:hypothetical protein n=1 Tax=Robiginitalea aestuariiviva TaxID=3036903 RepID=UPI00240DEFA0|nr:hypothetical protein [Robiginitalea aestuariiviva]MDG1571472.1 hypothetical protein [Robiginitalea aestuariiviva]
MFIIYFIYLTYYSKKYLPVEGFLKALKCIIVFFFFTLIFSQLIVLFDLQELHRPEGYFQSTGQLGIQYNHITNTYRFHSLSSEPSYAALVVIIAFAALNELIYEKRKLVVYFLMLLYMITFFKSSIGYIALALLVFGQIRFSKKHLTIFLLLIFTGSILFFFTNLGGRGVERVRDVVFLFFSFKGNFIHELNLIDSSAHARIGPFVRYIQQINLLDYHSYIGYGASSSEQFFTKIIYPEEWNSNLVFRPPFFPGFLYDYGIIGILLVGVFLWRQVKNQSLFFKLTLLIILLNSNFNTQLLWFFVIILVLTGFYIKTISEKRRDEWYISKL